MCLFFSVQTAAVKETDGVEKLSQYSGEMDPTRRRKYMAIGSYIIITFLRP